MNREVVSMPDKKPVATATQAPVYSPPYEEIRQAINKIHHGTVQLIIQDGRIVQIDTTEKRRLV
jgi:hypothetical protein